MSTFAVVPILPTLASLLPLLLVLTLSAVAALASLCRPAVALLVLRLIWRQKVVLLAFAGLFGLIAVSANWLLSQFATPPTRQVEVGRAWPASRGTLARRGWADKASGPASGGVVWSAGRPEEAFYASPAVVGNRVYCVGSRGDTGHIYAWDAETGSRVWSTAPRGYRATFSSPVVSGRYLVCGEGLHRTTTARVVCIDLDPDRQGTILWTFSTNSHVECTPIIDGDRVIVGAGDDGIYCLRLDPDATDAQRVVWHAPGAEYPDAESSPAVYDGNVYVGLGHEGQAICVLDAESGKELDRVAMPFPVFSAPAIEGGKLFVGMGAGDYVHIPDDPAGQVCCVDLKTLRIEWTFPVGATVLGDVVAAGGQIVFGSADGYLYVLTRDGRLKRKWNSHAPVLAAPAVTDDAIYLVNQAGMLYGLDRRELEPFWELRLGSTGRFISSPVVARGHVFVGSEAGGFVCAGESNHEPQSMLWPGRLGGPGATGCRDGSRLPQGAALRWSLSHISDDRSPIEVTGPIAATNDCLLAPMEDGARHGLACADLSGRLRWFFETPNIVVHSPAASGGLSLFVDGQRGDVQRRLYAVNVSSGRLAWSRPVDPSASGILTASRDSVFVQDSPEALSRLSLDGQELWTLPIGPICQGVDASTAILLAAVESPASVVAVDRASGAVLWRQPLNASPTTAPSLRKERICLGTAAGVEARRLVDGRRIWQLAGETTVAIHHTGDRCIFFGAKGDLIVADALTGHVLRRSAVAAAPDSAPLVAGNGALVVAEGRLERIGEGDQDGVAQVFGPMDLGTPTSPLVLHDDRVYLGVYGRGLVCLGGKQKP